MRCVTKPLVFVGCGLALSATAFTCQSAGALTSEPIVIQGVLPAAMDLPQINAVLRNTANGPDLTTAGGYYSIQAYLDTGTSGVVLSHSTWTALGVAQSISNGNPVVFNDVAIGGSNPYYVSAPYYIATAPFSANNDINLGGTAPPESAFANTIGPAPIELSETSNPLSSITGPLDIMGTPVMQGNVTVMYLTPANNVDNLNNPQETQTWIYNPNTTVTANPSNFNTSQGPGIVPTQYQIQLSYASFAQFTSNTPTGATPPVFAPNPMIGPNPVAAFNGSTTPDNTPPVTISYGGKTASGSFLLDTGAQASLISQAMAGTLGVEYSPGTYDTNNPLLISASTGKALPNQFSGSVSGAGGTSVQAAGFYLDSLSLQTTSGKTIDFQQAPVLVQDVTVTDPSTGKSLTLAGDLGMNFFEPSATTDLSSIVGSPFSWMTIDQPNGLLGLTLASSVPDPSALLLLIAGVGALAVLRRRGLSQQ